MPAARSEHNFLEKRREGLELHSNKCDHRTLTTRPTSGPPVCARLVGAMRHIRATTLRAVWDRTDDLKVTQNRSSRHFYTDIFAAVVTDPLIGHAANEYRAVSPYPRHAGAPLDCGSEHRYCHLSAQNMISCGKTSGGARIPYNQTQSSNYDDAAKFRTTRQCATM